MPPGCDPGTLSADLCTLESTPFVPTFADGEVVGVAVDLEAALALGFAPGTWWTAFSDGISCERVVASFTIDAVTP